jgi:hypothetical protein
MCEFRIEIDGQTTLQYIYIVGSTKLSDPETNVHECSICNNNNNLSEVGIPMLNMN